MAITSDSAKALARLGANLIISAESRYTTDTVKEIVRIAVEKNSHVTIHCNNYTTDGLKAMALIGGANVTIIL